MLNPLVFAKTLALFSEIYGFEYSKGYSSLVYESLREKTNDKDFQDASKHILQETKLTDWNKAYGFKGKPAIADWVEAFVLKKQFIEKTEYYKCSITGANLVRRVMVEAGNQLTIGVKNEK